MKELYSSGDSSIIRRRLTHTPSKHPTKSTPSKGKPTLKPVKRSPAPTRKPSLPKRKPSTYKPSPAPTHKPSPAPTPTPTSFSPFISVGSTYQTSPTSYLKFDSPTQLTRYIKEGSITTCTSLPYYISSNNFLVIHSMGGGSLTKTPTGLKYTSFDDNEVREMTPVTSNPLESLCNPETSSIGSYKNIVSIFNQQGDVYQSGDDYYVVKVLNSNKLNLLRYYNYDGQYGCEDQAYFTIIGPFAVGLDGSVDFMVTADGTVLQNIYYQGEMRSFPMIKATALPSGYQCNPMPDSTTLLDLMRMYSTNIAGKLVASIVMNGNILAYYTDTFNQNGNGIVYQLHYETGSISNTTFNIKKRYSNDRYNAKPLFFNGTEVFVESREGNFIQGYFSGEYHDFPAGFSLGDSKSVKYGRIGSNSYIFYCKLLPSGDIDDIYSYNMKTKVSQSLNVVAKVQDYFTGDTTNLMKDFNVKDNKIIWEYSWITNAMVYYDLNTATVGSFVSSKLRELNIVKCFTCDNIDAPLVSSNNELLMIIRDGLISKNNIVLSLGPSLTITSTSYTITGDLKLKDDISGIIYYFKKANNELLIYNDILNDASICSSKKWKQLDAGVFYTTDGPISYLTKPSAPADVITYNGIDMKILPVDSKIPSCLPEITVVKRSTHTLNDRYSFFSGSLNSDLVLVDTEWKPSLKTAYQFYNTTSNTEKSITLSSPPPKPSNYPLNTNYNLIYPIFSISGYVWVTENPPYIIRNNVAISISPALPEKFVIHENGAYVVAIVNENLVNIDLSTGSLSITSTL